MARDALRDAFFAQMDAELARFIDPSTGKVRAEYVERVPCPVCENSEFTVLFTKHGLDFVRCVECGFVYVNPRLKESIVERGYTGADEAASNRIWKDVLLSPGQEAFNTEAYTALLNEIKKRRPAGRLLDVGCSVGHFMQLASEKGYAVEGIEIEPEALAVARARRFSVHDKKLEEMNFPESSFNIVALLGLIEHVPNPRALMSEVRRVLVPGGLVAINGLPNVESAVVMALRDEARTFNGRNHLGYYSRQTLEMLLERTGFTLSFFETYVSGLDSILNHVQFLDTFGDVRMDFLPTALRHMVETNRDSIERKIIELGLGYKIRAIATRV